MGLLYFPCVCRISEHLGVKKVAQTAVHNNEFFSGGLEFEQIYDVQLVLVSVLCEQCQQDRMF